MSRRFNPPTYWHVSRRGAGRAANTMSMPIPGAWVEDNAAGESVHPRDLPPGAYLPDDESQYWIDVPGKWEICERCDGNGTHTNPSIDGNGITAEEWDEWDDDDREGYRTGRYDVACENKCDDGKVRVVDRDRCPPELLKLVDEWAEDEAEEARERAAERRLSWYEDGCPE